MADRIDNVSDNPLVLEQAGLSFALMGPMGSHRGILARSDHDNLNLAGFDNPLIANTYVKDSTSGKFLSTVAQPYAVHTDASVAQIILDDWRTTHLTFAWEGLATKDDVQKIQHLFREMAPDLFTAIKAGSHRSLEWQLSGMILLCERITERNRRRRKYNLALIQFMAILYVMAFAYMGFSHFF